VNEHEIRDALGKLQFHSSTSIILVLIGTGFLLFSLYYSTSKLTPLETEIAEKKRLIEELGVQENTQRERIEELEKTYATLKNSAEELYSVRVTPSNRVYEVKASARSTGRVLRTGLPEYRFAMYINSPEDVLKEIRRVTYRMEHPTFKQKTYSSTDAKSRFEASYVGWGCLSMVSVNVELSNGQSQRLGFNMCTSLGPQWVDE
jgi:hypothetical protein